MRIGVDAHVMTGKFQGTRTYMYYLYKNLCRLKHDHEFVFFGNWEGTRPFGEDAEHIDYLSDSRIKRLTYQTAPLIKKHGIDLLHVNYNAPLFLSCKLIVTLHDILWETHSQFFKPGQVLRNRLLSCLSSYRATQIHTVSEFTRNAVMQNYRVSREKIHVVPNGVDFNVYNHLNKEASAETIFSKYSVKDFILTVGRIEPRKNHLGLINACHQLIKRQVDLPDLVIIGQRDFSDEPVFQLVKQLNLEHKIHFLENISDDELPDFYRAAKLFIYPSFAEGFGLPPLEAMASGIPVITSRTTSMPEVTGTAASIIDPCDTDQLADEIEKIIGDHGLQEKMSQQSLARSKKWTWENAAKKYLLAVDHLS